MFLCGVLCVCVYGVCACGWCVCVCGVGVFVCVCVFSLWDSSDRVWGTGFAAGGVEVCVCENCVVVSTGN